MNEIRETQQKESEDHYRESKGFWEWWFKFKGKKGLSFFRIPLAATLLVFTISVGFGNFIDLIDYFRAEPLFTGMLFIVIFPVMIAISFMGVILWGSLLYIPYLVFEEESVPIRLTQKPTMASICSS